MTSPPDSPLSFMDVSDHPYDDGDDGDANDALLRPPKRIKVSASAASSVVGGGRRGDDDEDQDMGRHRDDDEDDRRRRRHPHDDDDDDADADADEDDHPDHHDPRRLLLARPALSDVSSDSSGDVPSSPAAPHDASRLLDDDDFQEQVTVCAWDGCGAGDCGDLDELVRHMQAAHVESQHRARRYTCEWAGCQRKGYPHASGYALRAHVRKHTREKPFFCYLPECDRSFTRSDALAKHMRTVHETEALRPSDPIPKSMQAAAAAAAAAAAGASISTGRAAGASKLKIIIKRPRAASGSGDGDDAAAVAAVAPPPDEDPHAPIAAHHGFTPAELAMPLPRLFRRCHRQLEAVEREAETLEDQCRRWEESYAYAWREKEALLEQVVQSEHDWHARRQAIISGEVDIAVPGVSGGGVKRSIEDPGEEERAVARVS
jgi:hypothetical protein